MKRVFLGVALLALSGMLSGCVTYTGPMHGALFSSVKRNEAVGSADGRGVVVRTKAQGVLGIAWGDASVEAAMQTGQINKIHHVDVETFHVLGLYATYTTTVYGERE
jgi:hypothetical protein